MDNNIDLYDFIQFPDKERRGFLNNHYKIFDYLIQIKKDILEKYNDKICPYEFVNYETSVSTWINEYNHVIFAIYIPLYQMLDIYNNLSSNSRNEDQVPYFRFLINYYSEIITYYIDCAFKKSVYIYNSMFDLKVNQGRKSFNGIVEMIKMNIKNNKHIDAVRQKLEEIEENKVYKEIIDIRNLNTHSIRATQQGFLDTYDKKTGITSSKITDYKDTKSTVEIILESLKILSDYTNFINCLEVDYYDSLYSEYLEAGLLNE